MLPPACVILFGTLQSRHLACRDWRGSVLSALDFAETRSEDDARLLTTARGRKKGDRMSADEAKALRRKVGGTASNYFKEWVDVKGAYADKGYVSKAELPTALPFLVLVVLGLVGAIGFVVTQTNAPPSPSASAAAEQRATLSREQREEYGLR
ncbi:hypothetical protein CVIRNUC_008363 [Coccomyxa viridis]|uniref:Uncharacterized protein n=1 Tax=Coccomyxa viridis TaxID=1274662 RepID=A0AAV1IG26_9CHLO|nr:hypothetical protein CVIRNUC_008363 [Coccomyxa viridis]